METDSCALGANMTECIPDSEIDRSSAPLNELDHRRLSRVKLSLERGLQVYKWWKQTVGNRWARDFNARLEDILTAPDRDVFPLLSPISQNDLRGVDQESPREANFGFFDHFQLDGRKQPIMGVVLQTFFDKPKEFVAEGHDIEAVLERWCDSVREFFLRYLIRLTSFNEMLPYVNPEKRPVEQYLRPFSWNQDDEQQQTGFGFSQIYYKRRGIDRFGKFRDADRDKINLKSVEDIEGSSRNGMFDWIVLDIQMHDLRLQPVRGFNLFVRDEVLVVLHREFIIRDDQPKEGIRRRYAFGYASLEDHPSDYTNSLVWQRPKFGFLLNEILVNDNGESLIRSTLVAERLPRLASVNPWSWPLDLGDLACLGLLRPALSLSLDAADVAFPGGFAPVLAPLKRLAHRLSVGPSFDAFGPIIDLANFVTFGQAERQLSISKEELLKSILTDMARSFVATAIGSRGAWRAISDWTQEEQIPEWLKSQATEI